METRSEAFRELTEQMANEQCKFLRLAHDQWLSEQVNQAFAKLESGHAEFVSAIQAEAEMHDFKAVMKQQFPALNKG